MYGIAGILELALGASPTFERLRQMADALVYRRPDEQGFYPFGAGQTRAPPPQHH